MENYNFENLIETMFGTSPIFTQNSVNRCKSYSTDDNFRLEFAVPAFKKDEINVSTENDILTISAEVKEENETFLKKSFESNFKIPKNADSENIDVKLENGVLIITINKLPKLKKRLFKIN